MTDETGAPEPNAPRHHLRAWRKACGLSLPEMVEALAGWKKGEKHPTALYLSRIETGERPYTQSTLEGYAAVLGCTPAALLSEEPIDPDAVYREIQATKQSIKKREKLLQKTQEELADLRRKRDAMVRKPRRK